MNADGNDTLDTTATAMQALVQARRTCRPAAAVALPDDAAAYAVQEGITEGCGLSLASAGDRVDVEFPGIGNAVVQL